MLLSYNCPVRSIVRLHLEWGTINKPTVSMYSGLDEGLLYNIAIPVRWDPESKNREWLSDLHAMWQGFLMIKSNLP